MPIPSPGVPYSFRPLLVSIRGCLMLRMVKEIAGNASAPCEAGEQAQEEQRSVCDEAVDA